MLRAIQFYGHQQALAAYSFYGRVYQQRMEYLFFRCYLRYDRFIQQRLHGSHARGTAKRVPAKSSDVSQHRVIGQRLHYIIRRDESTHGHTAAQRLAQ